MPAGAELKPEEREVHTGMEVHKTLPDTWRLYAECADEVTSMILYGGAWHPPADEAAFEASEWPRRLLEMHLEQCGACDAWRKAVEGDSA